jgi:uncharacterized protein YcbX
MSDGTMTDVGAVLSLWRYPVKSMIGEELHTAQVLDDGLLGDRVYALLDRSDGKVATAKNPRKWPNLFAFAANFVERADSSTKPSSVRITLPEGTVVTAEDSDVNQVLSKAVNRDVVLVATERGTVAGAPSAAHRSQAATAEEYWPDMDGLDHRDTVTDFELPMGTFFDCATVHVLTTATLDSLRRAYSQGRFEVPRFRPNIVVNSGDAEQAFPENDWVGQTVAVGDQVRLSITGPCGRCVMTTLPQRDLPMDREILRTAVRQNRANVGVYATVVRPGIIHQGDRVRLSTV